MILRFRIQPIPCTRGSHGGPYWAVLDLKTRWTIGPYTTAEDAARDALAMNHNGRLPRKEVTMKTR